MLSEMDVVDASLIADYASLTRVLVVTTGSTGCSVYAGGAKHVFKADPVAEVDPTGAGDIFATAFFVMLHQTGDLAVSARFRQLLRCALGDARRAGEYAVAPGSRTLPAAARRRG